MNRHWLLVALLCLPAVPVSPAGAQTQTPPRTAAQTPAPPRVGLALSGGSAKGLAHIGVLRALEDLGIRVDVVAGTSMGALVGGLYASGLDAAEIERIASEMDWTPLFTDGTGRRVISVERGMGESGTIVSLPFRGGRIGLPEGAVRGENALRALQWLTWPVQQIRDFRRLPRPFAAVTTDIVTGETVTLTSGSLAEAMRASMALTPIFDPVRRGDQVLIDGGYTRNLPAQDARALGADFVICSDVSTPMLSADSLRTLVDIVTQTVTLHMEVGTAPQRRLCDVLIRPEVDGLALTDFSSLEEWVERGRAATHSRAEELRRVPNAPPHRWTGSFLGDRVRLTRIDLVGTRSGSARRFASRVLALPPGSQVDAAAMDAALARLQETRRFGRALYHVEAAGADTILIVELEEQVMNSVGIGVRYDDHDDVALLLTGALRDRLAYGSILRAELRLGEQLQFLAAYRHGLGTLAFPQRGVDASLTRALFDRFESERRVAEHRSMVFGAGASLGIAPVPSSMLEARLGIEMVDEQVVDDGAADADLGVHPSVTLGLLRNTMERRSFPTRGSVLRLATRLVDDPMLLVDAGRAWPLGRATSLAARVLWGAVGGDPPTYRRFFLGGAYPVAVFGETQPPFWGLRPQERVGDAVHLYRLALQHELREGIFATAGLNAGNTFMDWRFRPAGYLVGWGVGLGASTLVGPAEVTLHGRGSHDPLHLSIRVGYTF